MGHESARHGNSVATRLAHEQSQTKVVVAPAVFCSGIDIIESCFDLIGGTICQGSRSGVSCALSSHAGARPLGRYRQRRGERVGEF